MGNSLFGRMLGAADALHTHKKANGSVSSERKAAIHYVGKGKDLYNAQRYADAAEQFREAINQDPGYARAHCYLGNTLHKLGSPEDAVKEWKKAVIVEPDSDSAAKAQAKLDKIAAQNQQVTRSLEEGLGMRKQGL